MRQYTQLICPLNPPPFRVIVSTMTEKAAIHQNELTGTFGIAKHTFYDVIIFSKIFKTPFREEKNIKFEEYLCTVRYIYALQRRINENRKRTERKKE